jgi:outer membrane protein assembly factor BamB
MFHLDSGAQSISEILTANNWLCTLEDTGTDISYVFKFAKTDTDSLSCHADVPESGFENAPMGKFLPDGNTIAFHVFEGEYDAEAHKISGLIGSEMQIEMTPLESYPEHIVSCPAKSTDWQFKTDGEIWSSPSMHEGSLLFGNDQGTFYKIDIESKSVDWSFNSGGSIRSKAAIANANVYVSSDDGHLYALDLESGSLNWETDIGNNVAPRMLPASDEYTYDIFCSSPIVDGNLVYVGSMDSSIYALQIIDGSVVWKYKTGAMIRSTPRIDNKNVYVGSWDHHMYALDKKEGTLLWKYNANNPIQSSPLTVDNKLIFGSRGAFLFGLDKSSGEELWKTNYWGSWVESSPVLYEGTVYVGSSDYRKVFALDPETGRPKWKFQTEGWTWATPAMSENSVYIGIVGTPENRKGMPGKIYCIDRKTGEAKWQMQYNGDKNSYTYGFGSSPIYNNGWMFVGGTDGVMYGFREEE